MLLIRFVWVRFFRKKGEVWSPWALVVAGLLALVLLSTQVRENRETIGEAAELTENAQDECADRGIEPFQDRVAGLSAAITRGECHAYILSAATGTDLLPYAEVLVGGPTK